MNAQQANSSELRDSALFKALLAENHKEFNQLRDKGETVSFAGAQLRGFDLRKFNLRGLDFRGSYLRNADLRGCDLRWTVIAGSSIREAKLSGTYFPDGLYPQEIMLSHLHGTRLRYQHIDPPDDAHSGSMPDND